MIDDTKVAGLLSDLQKLDEAGRDRILDLLSLEVMKDVLKASLRQSERRGDSTMPPNPPVTKDMSEVVHRQDERPTKQAGQTTVLKYHKRPRIEEDTRGQAIVEREVIEIETDEDDATNSLIIRRSSRLKECVRRMEMITDSEAELMRRFKDMWSMNEHTITQYTTYTHNLQKYTTSCVCIHSMLLAKDPTFTRGGRLYKSADDRCIDAGYPCASFRWDGRQRRYFIQLAPLPQVLPKGKSHEELGYWVL
ncbi:hypothetical protein COCMIDRAFT_38206 [Bipolaris oryzae ATCC 44560]|uniref:Uncharacterized protein n=1 Tax=Bipolaris oryzae ATCC 44560 TaxID=930090 RepID=W6YX16_COCMI|nr:uncharacterized protein COCMIDRAFT_38206 [Bipolaris oryzae ATCC 44560]EUC43937.1 hypothetical protein COCMIDRAFT_38206 [Bipolaris oryzae ATCC 44560]